ARYGFDLTLAESRTVATGIVVVCGLAVVLRLENQPGRRRLAVRALCAAMALLYLPALPIPLLRNLYELTTPTGKARLSRAVGAALGVGGMLGALRQLKV